MQGKDYLASSRFRTAMDLFAAGEDMMRLKLARENPTLAADEVEKLLIEWLRRRPGAELGDCPGPPRTAR
jgi:hypothetical protein